MKIQKCMMCASSRSIVILSLRNQPKAMRSRTSRPVAAGAMATTATSHSHTKAVVRRDGYGKVRLPGPGLRLGIRPGDPAFRLRIAGVDENRRDRSLDDLKSRFQRRRIRIVMDASVGQTEACLE